MSNGLMFLALLPGILIIIYVYRMDKVEKEPWRLILKLMIFGALSCIPASFMESAIDGAMPAFETGSLSYALAMAFASAALCEEICKFAFLHFGVWNNPEFGYRFDGIVYGVAVAVGFAVLENIMYVATGGLYVALMRGVLAVPLHSFCGVFMGIFFGAAKQAQVQGRSALGYKLLALVIPMLIHGTYDTLAFLGSSAASIALLVFVALMYIISLRYIRRFSRDDWKSGFYPETRPLSEGFGDAGAGFTGGGSGFSPGQGQGAGSTYRTAGTGYRAHPGEVQDGKLILLCPHCRRGLRVPAGMGQIRVRCPHCGQVFDAHS